LQIWIDLEENENCGYYPLQTFETRGEQEFGKSVVLETLPGKSQPHEVIGWCSDFGGSACDVTVVLVGDSGAGSSRLVKGGDFGLRIRPVGPTDEWSINATNQFGEPYLLLPEEAAYCLIDGNNMFTKL